MGLLGYNTVSLTDLTEVLPASLYLSSSLQSNSQIKEGGKYTPDFSIAGKEVIITPSFFMGNKEIVKKEGEADSPYRDLIRYQCGELDGGVEKTFSYTGITEGVDVWVDGDARLHYKKNLTQNIVIEAWIQGYADESGTTYQNVPALNPVNIFLLTESDTYSAFISSLDGREHFEEANAKSITLQAMLYSGASIVSDGVSYTWYQSSYFEEDGATLKPLETSTERGITVNGNKLIIERKAVKTLDTFICEIKNQAGTIFRVSMNILDKTDTFFGNIISDGSLVLTPEHMSIKLTNQIWSGIEQINSDASSESRFVYKWFFLSNESTEMQEFGNTKQVSVDLQQDFFPRANFVVYCQTLIDGKTYVMSNISIQYSPVSYTVQKQPESFFIPTMNDGGYYSSSAIFEKEMIFRLVGNDNLPLTFNNNTDSAPAFVEEDIKPFTVSIQQASGKWEFNIKLSFDPTAEGVLESFKELDNSFYLSFSYKYLDTIFQNEFIGIKNVAGSSGADGAPAYTIYLDNEFVSFSADGLGDLVSGGQKYTITPQVYLGADEKEYTITGVGSKSGIKTTIASDKKSFSIELNNAEISSLLNSPNGAIPVEVKVDEITFSRILTYSIRFSAVQYYLSLQETTVIRDLAGGFSPDKIIANALYKRGESGVPNNCTEGQIRIKAYGGSGEEIVALGRVQNISTAGSQMIFSMGNITTSVKYFIIELLNETGTETLDRQTIPILVDNGDIRVGGVNLLRYTKKMPYKTIGQQEYWVKNGCELVEIEGEENKGIHFTGEGSAFCQTMEFPTDGFSEYYTLSFDVNSEDYSKSNELYFKIAVYKDTEWRWRNIKVWPDGNNTKIVSGEQIDGKWMRLSVTFSPTFNNTFFNLPETADSDWVNIKRVGFTFLTTSECDLKVKKIKLEKGNVPTDWNESPYDISYEDIGGTNLLNTSFITKLYAKNKAPDSIWTMDFEKGDYTLSWDSATSSSSDNSTILRGNIFLPEEGIDFKANNSYTFSVPEENKGVDFILYTGSDDGDEEYQMYQLKLEKGTVATPYTLTAEQIRQYYNSYLDGSDGTVERIIEVLGQDGTIKGYLASDFDNFLEQINALNSQYQALNSSYVNLSTTVNGLSAWETYYSLDRDENTGRNVLTIGDKGADFDMKMRLDSTKMSFLNGSQEVAYISNEKLFINYAEIVQQMRIGSSSNTGYLVFKHMDGGLGVVWETK